MPVDLPQPSSGTRPWLRRLSTMLVGLGLLASTGLGLWLWKIGDTPATLPGWIGPQLLGRLLVCCAMIWLAGIVLWVWEAAPGRRVRRTVWALVGLTLYVGAVFGVAFGVYVSWWERGSAICSEAARLPTLAARRAHMERARSWPDAQFGDALETIFSCTLLVEELRRLEVEGACPFFPLPNQPCDCGGQAWPAAILCPTTVVCDRYREVFRCAEPNEQF